MVFSLIDKFLNFRKIFSDHGWRFQTDVGFSLVFRKECINNISLARKIDVYKTIVFQAKLCQYDYYVQIYGLGFNK